MLRTLAATTIVLIGSITAIAATPTIASAKDSGYSWGTYGSCQTDFYWGYKEYYDGRPDGRCVLQ